MASKDLTLKLKVDSKSGQAAIKKVADQLKGLETAKGISAASDDMKKMGVNAAKAAEEYRKLIDASKADAERLKKLISVKKRAADADIRAIADASRADAERLSKSITAEKQIIAARNKSHNEAIRMEKQRLAAINKTHLFSMRMQKQRIAEINTAYNEAARMNKQHDKTNALLRNRVGIIGKIKKSLFAMRSYWLAISAAVSIAAISVVKFFKAGFMAVERFRLSVASVAASITTFSDLSAGDVDRVYANAVKYAEQLALKMEIINVRTIATGEQLRAMNETFIQQGVLLDINSKKQEDAFVSVANAISLITQGQNQEIQMRQEVRGLLSGDIRATNLLARMINAKLGGALKENITLWKQQGTLLENLGKHLEGFKAGSADLASTWAALSTTFETIANRYLRAIFKPIYEDIIKSSLKFSRSLLGQKKVLGDTGKILKDELLTAWESTKSIVKGVGNLLDGFKEPLLFMVKMVNMAVKGWALIFEHVTDIGLTMKEKFLTEEGVRSWIIPFLRSIGYEGDVIQATPLGEEEKKPEAVEKPTLITPKTEEQLRAEEKYWKKINELDREYHREKIKLDYEGFERRRKLQKLETDYLAADHKESLDIVEMIKKVHHVKMAQIDADARKERIKEEEKLRKATKKALEKEKEEREKFMEFVSSERENRVRAIFKEADALKYVARSREELSKIEVAATAKIQALETETADKRKKNHEQVLQFISTELENKIRAIDLEKEKLLELATSYAEQAAIYEAAAQKKAELQDLTAMEEWAASSISILEQVDAVAIEAAESFSTGFTDAFFEFAEGTKSAGDAFRDFAVSFFNQLTKMIMQQFILNTIKDLMGTTSTTASAKAVAGNAAETASVTVLTQAYIALAAAKALSGIGGAGGVPLPAEKGMAISGGQKMMEYANGGVVDRPTTFPMRNGTGLMGEAGPEAIMPLKRGKGGRLGVESNGDKDVQVMPQEINIVNTFNPAMLDEFLASSKGQDAIVNVIGNRSQTVKRILR